MPPLRSRREDIPLLFEYFLALAAERHGRALPELDSTQLHELMAYAWPGNVRELRNTTERYALGFRALPGVAPADKAVSLSDAVETFERALIVEALRRHNGNLSRAAESLSMAKTTLFDKIRKYGIEP